MANSEPEGIRFFNGDSTEALLEVFFVRLDPTMTVIGVEEFFHVQIEGYPPL